MLSILVSYPEIAFGIALAVFALYYWQRSKAALIVSAIWMLYAVYEILMRARILCSGECNIRVDLLLLYPLLALATIAAIVLSFWRRTHV